MAKKRKLPKALVKPADPTSDNPYFRQYPSAEFARAKSRQRSVFLAEKARLIGKVKPRKADLGKVVYLATRRVRRGKKIFNQVYRPTEKQLLYVPVYAVKAVQRKGTLKFGILNAPDPKTIAKGVRKMPTAQRLDQFDARKLQKRPFDYKKHLQRMDEIFAKKIITKKLRIPRGVKLPVDAEGNVITDRYVIPITDCKLDKFFDSAITIWKQLVESQFRKRVDWQLQGIIYYRDSEGDIKAVDFAPNVLSTARFYEISGTGKLARAFGKTKASRKLYTDKYLRDLYGRFIYAGMAAPLAARGVVSKSSVRRIAAMRMNQDKPRSKWKAVTMKGKKVKWWAQDDELNEEACIESVEFWFKGLI